MKRTLLIKLLKLLIFFFIIGASYYGYQYYANNKSANWPDQLATEQAFYKSVDWLDTQYPLLKSNHNSALWWMLKEASDISDNKKLTKIFRSYEAEFLNSNLANIWTPFFRKFYRPIVPDISEFSSYSPYQIFFVYALSCDKHLEQEAIIQQQLEADFCGMHYLSPRCVTHQLMSVRLMQERYCGDDSQLAALSASLQEMIVDELNYDFRVTDSYLQRVLVLAEIGNFKAIKPVWLQRILDAQNEDGGWDDLHPILTLSDTHSIGWTSTLPRYTSKESNFHATAQGIWLLALVLQHERSKAEIPQTNETIELQ